MSCSLPAAIGDQCLMITASGEEVPGEVIGFANGRAFVVPFEHPRGVRPGMSVIRMGSHMTIPVGSRLLGRVVDGRGRPVDDRGPLGDGPMRSLSHEPPPAMDRQPVQVPFATGQRAIDGLLTCGRGQRVGIFAGSGVGKSTLLGEIAKGSEAEVNVIALIGERSREVRPFLEECLGSEGLQRSVVVVSTCDQTALMRVRAVQAAVTVAEYFRDRGANVLLLMDSLTRFAMAQRELGLALGEPPSARGYTPSVFQLLAATLERLGNGAEGSITGFITVLVDGDDLDEPISDAARSLLDGHIVLDRRMAERAHFPAISVAKSISRVSRDVCDMTHLIAARNTRSAVAVYEEAEDLIRIGAYAKGTSPPIDRAIELMPVINGFLQQEVGQRSTFEETRSWLERIAAAWPF